MLKLRAEGLALRLRAEAVRRGIMPPEGLDEDPTRALCGLVRAIPYGPPSVRRPAAVVEAWRGTSAGKHALLLAALREAGIPARAFVRTHRVGTAEARAFGPGVEELVPAGGLVDVHVWLAVAWRGRLRAVDVTFPEPPLGRADEAASASGGGGAAGAAGAEGLRLVSLPMPLACGQGEDLPLGPEQDVVGAADALAALRGDRMAREALLEAIAGALDARAEGEAEAGP